MADIKIAGRIKAGTADNIAGYASEILFDDEASNKTVKEKLEGKQDTLTFDNTPTANSNNPVKSSGIKTALDAKQTTISTVNVTVDNNTGTPSGSASVSGSTLSLSFKNLKGATGATGATGPQGPQGERGLPGESGVTGDVSGFTVIQTIDPSATYGATDIAGAATVQATNQELTELEEEVDTIKSKLPTSEIVVAYGFSDFTDGKFFNTSQSVGTTIPAVSTNSSFAYLLLDCEEGQNFHIVGVGGNSARLWCFVDARNKKISSSEAAAGNTTTGTDITAPANAAQVYIQISKSSTPNYSTVVSVETISTGLSPQTIPQYVEEILDDYDDETVQPLISRVDNLEKEYPFKTIDYSFSDFTDGKFFNTSQSVGTTIPAVSTNSSFAYLLLDCEEGQNFHIVGVGGSTARLWCFVDARNKKISSSDAGAGNTTTGTDIVAPANAAQVYIQISKSSTPNYATVVSVKEELHERYSLEEYVQAVTNDLQNSLEEYVDTSVKEMRTIKILAIGNSYSINAMCYIPWILDNIAPEVDYTFGIWLYGGATLEHHYDIISNNTTGNNYIKMKKGDTKWNASTGGSTISALMADEDWDIVTLQQASAYHADYSTYQPYLNDIVKSLFGYAQRSIRFGWLFTPSKQTTLSASVTDYENISACVQRVMNETAVDFIIPAGTALQNARTVPALQALGDSGNMTYQQHMQSGIPCLVEAYAYTLSILREIGMNYRSVYADSFIPDSTWETNTGMTSLMDGSPVGLTDANRMAAAICAIQALKKPYEITDCASIV